MARIRRLTSFLVPNAFYRIRDIAAALLKMNRLARKRVALIQTVGRPHANLLTVERDGVLYERERADAICDVLEEPTNYLAIRCQLSRPEFVRELRITVISALHDLNLAAQYCDRICLMEAGKMAALGAPADVMTSERIAQVYGVDMLVQRHPTSGHPFLLPS